MRLTGGDDRMTSKMQEMIDELPGDGNYIVLKLEDLQFLKDKYADMRHETYLSDVKKDVDLSSFLKGIARGLEIALVRMGVSNDELDKISKKAYCGCGG